MAFPLLKRYGYKAVAFVIPGLVEEETVGRSNLEGSIADPSKGNVPDTDRRRLCTWAELRVMQESGVIDIQSHSLNHARMFISPKVVDFYRPKRSGTLPKLSFPVYRESGRDRWDRTGRFGMPLYEGQSVFSGRHRYFDDEKLREMCVQYVTEQGGRNFFHGRIPFESFLILFKTIGVHTVTLDALPLRPRPTKP